MLGPVSGFLLTKASGKDLFDILSKRWKQKKPQCIGKYMV